MFLKHGMFKGNAAIMSDQIQIFASFWKLWITAEDEEIKYLLNHSEAAL